MEATESTTMDKKISENLIEVRGLTRKLGNLKIIRGLDLDVRRGEILVIIGKSGEGKSVLLKHLAGLLDPDKGSIKIKGREIVGLSERELNPIRRQVGMMFQDGALFDSMTVSENVGFPLEEERCHSPEEIDSQVKEMLTLVGMESHSGKMPINLSGGMRKRVALARAIITHPDVILYDEPTAGLDPIGAGSIDRLIQETGEKFGITSVVVTHDLNTVRIIADRVAVLRKGRITFEGNPNELKNSDKPFLRAFIEGRDEESGTADMSN